jgi:ParB family transcriptional regulator, chromosome partitioning protein
VAGHIARRQPRNIQSSQSGEQGSGLSAGLCRYGAGNAKEKGKVIKSVIADFLTGSSNRPKVDGWVPKWMKFPPSAYTERGGVATVAAANRAAWLAEAEEPLDPDPAAAVAAETVEGGDAETAEMVEEVEEQQLAA